jgi:hypothetical protein
VDDERQPLIGQIVELQTPLLGPNTSPTLRFEIVEMYGLTALMRPVDPATPLPRAGMPLLVWFDQAEQLRRLEAIIIDGSPPPGCVLVRLPKLPERRQHLRHSEKLRVSVQPIGDNAGEAWNLPAVAVDLSVGGARVWVKEPVPGKQECFLVIGIPDQPPTLAIAESVAESRPVEDGWHEVRFQFTTIADEERGRLTRYLTSS